MVYPESNDHMAYMGQSFLAMGRTSKVHFVMFAGQRNTCIGADLLISLYISVYEAYSKIWVSASS